MPVSTHGNWVSAASWFRWGPFLRPGQRLGHCVRTSCTFTKKRPVLSQPFDLEHINRTFFELESKGRKQLEEDGVDPDRMVFQRFVEVKYRMQIHQLPVPVPAGQAE